MGDRAKPNALAVSSPFLVAVLTAGGVAAGDVTVQRWAVGQRATHPQSIKIASDGEAAVIEIDLRALFARRAKVHEARLLVQREPLTGADEEAGAEIRIFPSSGPAAKQPLRLLGPWYDCFSATEPVRACLAAKRTCRLHVKTFPRWRKEATALEVTFEAKPAGQPPPAVKGLAVFHRAGQTFITWKEIDDPFGEKPPTLGAVTEAIAKGEARRRVRYRVYRHDKPIDRASLADAVLLAEVKPLSGLNVRGVSLDRLICQHQRRAVKDPLFARKIARGPFRAYHPGMAEMAEVRVDRLAVEPGKALPAGTGLYVHHPGRAGKAWYAVVVSVDGTANTADVSSRTVVEQVGPGEPVFQGVEDLKVFYDYPGQRRRYVQWCAPPLANRPNQYYNWGVYVPPPSDSSKPLALGVYFHDRKGLYLRPHWPHPGDMVLLSPHDEPRATFGYGYHESLDTLRSFRKGVVGDFTARRIDAFLDWVCKALPVDTNRMSCHGMGVFGGTAALHYALRAPERFALVVAGAFDADPKSTPAVVRVDGRARPSHRKALEAVWGRKEWQLPAANGKSIWEDRDLVDFVRRSPKRNLPFLSLGTGSQHNTWPRENALLKALWKSRQPFRTDFTWGGQAPHFGMLYARRNRLMLAAVPDKKALSRARWYADDRWQKGRQAYWGGGTINMDLRWQADDVVDTPDQLEVTGGATGDLTLRNLQRFKLKPGERVRWRVKAKGRKDRTGIDAADANGVLTIPGIGLRGRLIVTRLAGGQAAGEGVKQ